MRGGDSKEADIKEAHQSDHDCRRGGGGETAQMPPKSVGKPPPYEQQAPASSSSACASAEPKPTPEPEPAAPATVVAEPEGEFSFEDMVRQSGGASPSVV